MNKEPIILAIETSSRTGSVAIGFGQKIAAEKSFSGFMKHSSEILPTIQSLLNQFDLTPDKIEHLYISYGPGSFTGLRIAVSLAKIMYLTNSLKIVAVDSLDVVAYNAIQAIKEYDSGRGDDSAEKIVKIASVIDAKRSRFFTALYNIGRNGHDICLEKATDDLIITSDELCQKASREKDKVWLLGDGLLYYRQSFEKENINIFDEKYWGPRAACVYNLGWEMAQKNMFSDPLELKPNYLYHPEIRVKQR